MMKGMHSNRRRGVASVYQILWQIRHNRTGKKSNVTISGGNNIKLAHSEKLL